jgi:hypothetical protein
MFLLHAMRLFDISLINVEGILPLAGWWEVNLLAGSVPIIEIPNTSAEISSVSQPSQIRSQGPASNRINLAPKVSQITDSTSQSNDISSGFDGTFGNEEEWHPKKVETELDGVERRAVLCCLDYFGGLERREAAVVSAVGGVAHETVEDRPHGTEDLGWWAVWWLLEGHVGLLSWSGYWKGLSDGVDTEI